jgi:hypothetical protein
MLDNGNSSAAVDRNRYMCSSDVSQKLCLYAWKPEQSEFNYPTKLAKPNTLQTRDTVCVFDRRWFLCSCWKKQGWRLWASIAEGHKRTLPMPSASGATRKPRCSRNSRKWSSNGSEHVLIPGVMGLRKGQDLGARLGNFETNKMN